MGESVMLRKMGIGMCVMGAIAVCLSASTVHATLISVSNYSFESPSLTASPYYNYRAVSSDPSYGDWSSSTAVVGSNGTVNKLYGSTRTFAGMDGDQTCWADTGGPNGIFQDLSGATYEVGKSYKLTVGIAALNDGATANISLFARNGATIITAGTTGAGAPSLSSTAMTDYVVTVPTVQSTDAWAGKNIAISLKTGVGGTCWFFDNVRLESTATPEPGTLVLLASGLIGLLAYAWRKRR
jgi:hypothetical protein